MNLVLKVLWPGLFHFTMKVSLHWKLQYLSSFPADDAEKFFKDYLRLKGLGDLFDLYSHSRIHDLTII